MMGILDHIMDLLYVLHIDFAQPLIIFRHGLGVPIDRSKTLKLSEPRFRWLLVLLACWIAGLMQMAIAIVASARPGPRNHTTINTLRSSPR